MSEIWLAALDPITGANRPLGTPGSGGWARDYFDMFDDANDANWPTVAGHVDVIMVYETFVHSASDEQLLRMADWSRRTGVDLAFEAGVMPVLPGYGVEGMNSGLFHQARRLADLGVPLKYFMMDTPFSSSTVYKGPGGPSLPVEETARLAAISVAGLRALFPDLQVGTVETFPFATHIESWLDAYAKASGEPFAVFHADVNWPLDYQDSLRGLKSVLEQYGSRYGVIYNATPRETDDVAWADRAMSHYRAIEADPSLRPPMAVFQSWMPNPARLFPETLPGSMSNLVLSYLIDQDTGRIPAFSSTSIPKDPPMVNGLLLRQQTTDHSVLSPFTTMRLNAGLGGAEVTARVSIDPAAGRLEYIGPRTASFTMGNGFFEMTGAAKAVEAGLRNLVFRPAQGGVPGQIISVPLRLSVSSAAGGTSDTVQVSSRTLGEPVAMKGGETAFLAANAQSIHPYPLLDLSGPRPGTTVAALVSIQGAVGRFTFTANDRVATDQRAGQVAVSGSVSDVQDFLRSLAFQRAQGTGKPDAAARLVLSTAAPVYSRPDGGTTPPASFTLQGEAIQARPEGTRASLGYAYSLGGKFTPFEEWSRPNGVLDKAQSPWINPALGGYVHDSKSFIMLHPGALEKGVLRITIDRDDVYSLKGTFEAGDPRTDTDVHVLVNGKPVFDGFVKPNQPSVFDTRMMLAAGTTVDFVVANNGSGEGPADSTAVSGTVTRMNTAARDGWALTTPYEQGSDLWWLPQGTLPSYVPDIAYTDAAIGIGGHADTTDYSGSVAWLDHQYIWSGANGVAISASRPNTFLKGGAGDDALAVTSGRNVLDGGTGSNFLVGGTGADVFFVDGRGTASTWSTVVGLNSSDAVTLWGFSATASQDWVSNEGAAGYKGATLHMNGNGTTASVTLAGVSASDIGKTVLSSTGQVDGNSYLYLQRI